MGCSASADVDRPSVHRHASTTEPVSSSGLVANPLCMPRLEENSQGTHCRQHPPPTPAAGDGDDYHHNHLHNPLKVEPRFRSIAIALPSSDPLVGSFDSDDSRGTASTDDTTGTPRITSEGPRRTPGSGPNVVGGQHGQSARGGDGFEPSALADTDPSPAKVLRSDVSRKTRRPPPPPTREAAVLRMKRVDTDVGSASNSARGTPLPRCSSFDARRRWPRTTANTGAAAARPPCFHIRNPCCNNTTTPAVAVVRARPAVAAAAARNEMRAFRFDPRSLDVIEAQLDISMACITKSPCREDARYASA